MEDDRINPREVCNLTAKALKKTALMINMTRGDDETANIDASDAAHLSAVINNTMFLVVGSGGDGTGTMADDTAQEIVRLSKKPMSVSDSLVALLLTAGLCLSRLSKEEYWSESGLDADSAMSELGSIMRSVAKKGGDDGE